MNNSKFNKALNYVFHNGGIGFIACLISFIPSCFLTNSLWSYIFSDLLKKRFNVNIDDYLLVYFFFPLALVVSLILGTLGGYLGSRLIHSPKGATLGSIIGGVLAGVFTSSWMTFEVVSRWATYYDIK